MLGALSDKMQQIFSDLRGKHRLSESNIADAVREVRMALLEADVNYGVAKKLVKLLKEKAVGAAVLKAVQPGQQFIKIVHDELAALMGGEEAPLSLEGALPVWMLCGLQGSGKTTHCVKLARYLVKKGLCKRPLIAACDLQRPAAIQQLKTLAEQVSIPVYSQQGEDSPLEVARGAKTFAQAEGHDLLIVDTAGRLHVDEALMAELHDLKKLLQPQELLFVANAATGQDAVNTAARFNEEVDITGSILTMLDGNTRGGAAISIKEVTGKPLKFEGIGEKVGDLQPFNPTSMADRILGMGDTINLVRKAQEHVNEEDAKAIEDKLRKAAFTFEDYLNQMQMVKKMGSFKSLLSMVPGMNKMTAGLDVSEKEFTKVEAIILSMTADERAERCQLVPARRKRIAQGSGTKIEDVNKLLKGFKQAKKFFKNLPAKKNLEKMMGGRPSWR